MTIPMAEREKADLFHGAMCRANRKDLMRLTGSSRGRISLDEDC